MIRTNTREELREIFLGIKYWGWYIDKNTENTYSDREIQLNPHWLVAHCHTKEKMYYVNKNWQCRECHLNVPKSIQMIVILESKKI